MNAPSTPGVVIQAVKEFLNPDPRTVEVQIIRSNGASNYASEDRFEVVPLAPARHLLHVSLSVFAESVEMSHVSPQHILKVLVILPREAKTEVPGSRERISREYVLPLHDGGLLRL